MKAIKNVLIIDNNAVSNLICKALIKKENFAENINFYTSVEKALDALVDTVEHPEQTPDVIFLDLNMPIMNGWEFLEEYALLPNEIKNRCLIYILSSSVNPKDIERAKACTDVKGFYSKPLSSTILKDIQQTS